MVIQGHAIEPRDEVPETDDRKVRDGRQGLEVGARRDHGGEVRGEVVVGLDQPAEAGGAEVAPREPQLERPPSPGALEPEFPEVQADIVGIGRRVRIGGGRRCHRPVAGPVVLGSTLTKHGLETGPVADHEPTDVVGLEEPLVRIDRDRIRSVEVRDSAGVAGRQERAGAVGRIDVEPQPLVSCQVGELADGVDRSGVGGTGDGRDRDGRQAALPVRADGRTDRPGS